MGKKELRKPVRSLEQRIQEHGTKILVERARGRDASEVLGELSASVTHLHVHTKGLDELIDNLPSE